jgi:hypothetical protein
MILSLNEGIMKYCKDCKHYDIDYCYRDWDEKEVRYLCKYERYNDNKIACGRDAKYFEPYKEEN